MHLLPVSHRPTFCLDSARHLHSSWGFGFAARCVESCGRRRRFVSRQPVCNRLCPHRLPLPDGHGRASPSPGRPQVPASVAAEEHPALRWRRPHPHVGTDAVSGGCRSSPEGEPQGGQVASRVPAVTDAPVCMSGPSEEWRQQMTVAPRRQESGSCGPAAFAWRPHPQGRRRHSEGRGGEPTWAAGSPGRKAGRSPRPV